MKKIIVLISVLAAGLWMPSAAAEETQTPVGIGFVSEKTATTPKSPSVNVPTSVPAATQQAGSKNYPKTGENKAGSFQRLGVVCLCVWFWLFLFTRLRQEEEEADESLD